MARRARPDDLCANDGCRHSRWKHKHYNRTGGCKHCIGCRQFRFLKPMSKQRSFARINGRNVYAKV
jgi:hypothetical protein